MDDDYYHEGDAEYDELGNFETEPLQKKPKASKKLAKAPTTPNK
jgi:hypothetical protein